MTCLYLSLFLYTFVGVVSVVSYPKLQRGGFLPSHPPLLFFSRDQLLLQFGEIPPSSSPVQTHVVFPGFGFADRPPFNTLPPPFSSHFFPHQLVSCPNASIFRPLPETAEHPCPQLKKFCLLTLVPVGSSLNNTVFSSRPPPWNSSPSNDWRMFFLANNEPPHSAS